MELMAVPSFRYVSLYLVRSVKCAGVYSDPKAWRTPLRSWANASLPPLVALNRCKVNSAARAIR